MTGWPGVGLMSWTDVGAVRARLAAGADPNARLYAVRNTPLHNALWELGESAEVVDLLIAHGADVEAINEAGETPLWCAVRRGYGDAVASLLAAGADPWRPVLGGRSAGRVALDGPLVDVFAGLPGAPDVSADDRRRQADADALVASYGDLREVAPAMAESMCVAFVGGVDEDEVIRRAGAEPAACPVVTADEFQDYVWIGASQRPALWVGTPPGGGVVVYGGATIDPVDKEFCRRASDRAVLAGTFDNPAGGDQTVQCWRDGTLLAWPSPYDDPRETDPPEAWLCRFGDHAHESADMARNLALMAMLTGTRPDPGWLFNAPKRLVG